MPEKVKLVLERAAIIREGQLTGNDEALALFSIAISLKRIADIQEARLIIEQQDRGYDGK